MEVVSLIWLYDRESLVYILSHIPIIYTYIYLPCLYWRTFKLYILTLSKPIAQRFSIFLVYSGLETGAPAYTCAQSRAVCLNISGFCLYYTKERGRRRAKLNQLSNPTKKQDDTADSNTSFFLQYLQQCFTQITFEMKFRGEDYT